MRAQNTSSIGLFYKNLGFYLEVSDCEELVGVAHRRWWGWFYKDESVFDLTSSINI